MGLALRTHEQKVIPPRINTPLHKPLRHSDLLGGGVVRDAEVGGPPSEVVEGPRGVGFQPGDGEGRALGFADLGVDEGVGEGFEETGLAGAAGGDAETERGVGGAVVGF